MEKLSEAQAKAILARHGFPVTQPSIVHSSSEAVRAAASFGGRVAIKISSPDIAHKARVGCVRIGVSGDLAGEAYDEVVKAAAQIEGARVEGVIVEPMAANGIEVILGAIRDSSFGPVVMFGLGGSAVESRKDVEFRLAPVTETEAVDLVESIDFPGPVSPKVRDDLANAVTMMAGEDGIVFKESLDEVDINPLIVSEKGILAVDAYMVRGSESIRPGDMPSPRPVQREELFTALQPVFNPTGIVVVGASTKPGKLGFTIVKNLVDFGFRGRLYAVHPSANNIYGVPCFPRVEDLPENVDRAIIAVQASEVPNVLRSCASRGVKVAQVYSAGFAEWNEAGKSYEADVLSIVRETGMRVIGPNTIGTFSASGHMTLTVPRYSPTGLEKISFIGQSGTYVLDVISRSKVIGLPLGKSLSCGNCVDLGPVEYLSFLASDPQTEIIGMYLETTKDAGTFFRMARSIKKPLILMKGGRSGAGLKAASSHTGALAGDLGLWVSSARQAGAILVETIDDMLDVFLMLSAAGGQRWGDGVALFTSGGGISVSAADYAAANGLNMVDLARETRNALARFGVPGTSIQNPIDIPVWGLKSDGRFIFHEMIETLARDPNVDSVIACVEVGSIFSFSADEAEGREQLELVAQSIVAANTSVPVSVVLRTTGDRVQDDFLRGIRPELLTRGIAVFPNVERAIRSHAAVAATHKIWKSLHHDR